MEQQPSQPAEGEEQQRYKTLGVRIDEDLHAQLSFIAHLTGSTIADERRHSIEGRVQAAQSDPELIAAPRKCGPRSNAKPKPASRPSPACSASSPSAAKQRRRGRPSEPAAAAAAAPTAQRTRRRGMKAALRR